MAKKVAIIGGGIAGVTTALVLGNRGVEVTLFEKNSTLVSGPPFCHLHAGGNLYREISDAQCATLLRQSIDFAKLYPQAIDKRPTVIALPRYDKQDPKELLPRLEFLQAEYAKLIKSDPTNRVLGAAEGYYELFSKEELLELLDAKEKSRPQNNREWLIPFAKSIDFERIKFPIIVVQEYGINLFRVGAVAGLALEQMPNVKIRRECEVIGVQKSEQAFILQSKEGEERFDYLINAAGFRTGVIDQYLGIKEERLLEFKAAYLAWWESQEGQWPEVIFHGERGTPKGMGQFTPYCSGYVQLHAMTQDITLCKECLVKSGTDGSYPQLSKELLEIVEHGWSKEKYSKRTERAIEYLAHFFPQFKEAKVGAQPLYGIQQIPGSDPTRRVAEVAFPMPNYARCEIVKVSSVVDMVKEILKNMGEGEQMATLFAIKPLSDLAEDAIAQRASEIAQKLNYPQELSQRCNSFVLEECSSCK